MSRESLINVSVVKVRELNVERGRKVLSGLSKAAIKLRERENRAKGGERFSNTKKKVMTNPSILETEALSKNYAEAPLDDDEEVGTTNEQAYRPATASLGIGLNQGTSKGRMGGLNGTENPLSGIGSRSSADQAMDFRSIVAITTHLVMPTLSATILGYSDGTLVVHKPGSKQETIQWVIQAHKGPVLALAWADDLVPPHGLLLSAGSDRVVKVWDLHDRGDTPAGGTTSVCVQTLVGHQGSVVSLSYCAGQLLTVSTDARIIIWECRLGRALLRYPWFVPVQVLQSGKPGIVYPTAVAHLLLVSRRIFFCADSRGHITTFVTRLKYRRIKGWKGMKSVTYTSGPSLLEAGTQSRAKTGLIPKTNRKAIAMVGEKKGAASKDGHGNILRSSYKSDKAREVEEGNDSAGNEDDREERGDRGGGSTHGNDATTSKPHGDAQLQKSRNNMLSMREGGNRTDSRRSTRVENQPERQVGRGRQLSTSPGLPLVNGVGRHSPRKVLFSGPKTARNQVTVSAVAARSLDPIKQEGLNDSETGGGRSLGAILRGQASGNPKSLEPLISPSAGVQGQEGAHHEFSMVEGDDEDKNTTNEGATKTTNKPNTDGDGGDIVVTSKYVTHGKPRRVHSLGVSHVLVVAEEHLCITLSFDNTVRAHDTQTGASLFAVENPHRCRYTALCWDKTFQDLVLGDASGSIQVWSIHDETCVCITRTGSLPILHLSLLQDGRLIVTTPAATSVWHIVRLKELISCQGHTAPVLSLAWVGHRTEDFALYSAALDNEVRFWDPFEATCMAMVVERRGDLSCMLHIPFSVVLASGLESGAIKITTTASGVSMYVRHHTDSVVALAFAFGWGLASSYLISASLDGIVALWKVSTASPFSSAPELCIIASNEEILCVASSSSRYVAGLQSVNHSFLLTSGQPVNVAAFTQGPLAHGKAYLRAQEDAQPDGTTSSTESPTPQVKRGREYAWYSDLMLIITGGNDGIARVWCTMQRRCVAELLPTSLEAIEAALDAELMDTQNGLSHTDISSTMSTQLGKGRDIGEGYNRRPLMPSVSKRRELVGAVTCVELDGYIAIVGSEDRYVRAYDTLSQLEIASHAEHAFCPRGIAVLPGSGLVATCAQDGLIVVWSYVTGQVMRRFAQQRPLRCLTFTPPSRQLFVGTSTGPIIIMDVSPQLLAPWSPYIMDTRDRPLTTKLTTQLTYPQSSSSNSPATDALDHPTPIKSFAQLRDDKTEFSYSSHTPRDNTTLKGGPAHIEVGGGIRASSISEAQAKVATRFTVTTMSQEIALLTQWVVDLERDVQQLTENIAEID